MTVGLLAVQIVTGNGGHTTGPAGALASISRQWYGQVLLSIIALGLFGYALWRFAEAWVDPDRKGSDLKGISKRLGYAISGIIYGALAVEAVLILLGLSYGNDDSADHWTAQLMVQPYGRWLVALVGIVVIGVGFYNLYRAYSAQFCEKLKLNDMSESEITMAKLSGRTGHVALSVINYFVGGFLIIAALRADPEQAGGLEEALDQLLRQPYGLWLLGAFATGLILYGLFMLVMARYRKVFMERL